MPRQNSLPTWAHTDLDTLITLLVDSAQKLKKARTSPNLPALEREALDEAYDDVRLALLFARTMRERQEDIVEPPEPAEQHPLAEHRSPLEQQSHAQAPEPAEGTG